MNKGYLYYPLVDGYIHNWLMAGPQAITIEVVKNSDKLQIVQDYYQPETGITGAEHSRCNPVEYGAYQCTQLADDKHSKANGKWRYVCTLHDHLVDISASYPLTHYLRAWAYTEIESLLEQDITLVLTTYGLADLWLNERHLHRHEHFHHQSPRQVHLQAHFEAGINQLMVRVEAVAMHECILGMALQLVGFRAQGNAGNKVVRIPTIAPDLLRRQRLEALFEACHIRQDIYAHKEEIIVYVPEGPAAATDFNIRLQTPGGSIHAEANRQHRPETQQSMGFPSQIPEGSYELMFLPPPVEYYEKNVRITRSRRFYVIGKAFSTQPYGSYEERRNECLKDAARRRGNIFAEIAKMALGRWNDVNEKAIQAALEDINQHSDRPGFMLCGSLIMLYRHADQDQFPAALRQPLEDYVLNSKYGEDRSGIGTKHSILLHTCEILAGQHYPDRFFTHINQSGKWLHEKGERLVLEWLKKCACNGFPEWDSHSYFEEYTLALSTLTSLAKNPQIWELAALVLDKMLFTIAVNSFEGVFGSTHRHSCTTNIKTAYRQPTAGITRLLWGMGIFNEHISGLVGLACSTYELPAIIAAIAADQAEELWSKEQHRENDSDSVGSCINKVTYKTPDMMLCSAQDWHPGKPGCHEHIWQATLSPKVTVFTSHPACAAENNSHHPDYWHGNVTLPRVAQWKDVLIALYNSAEGDWMGFTHAYFPIYGMDAHEIRGCWAFGKVGEGYIALAAANGLDFQTGGDNAYRELRSPGTPNTWLCQMGRAALDGSFSEFVEKVLALSVKFEEKQVELTSLRGDRLCFGWQGALLLNGESQPLSDFKHYDNPYCICELEAPIMEIRFAAQAMRLHFQS